MADELSSLPMPDAVHALWKAQQALAKHYTDTGLKFTLDGRLVGDIAEALALEHFDLVWPKKRTKGVDALTKADETVQIKATGRTGCGPTFTPGEGAAKYLLFFQLDFPNNVARVAYNGPEAPIRALLPNGNWAGSIAISLADIQRLAKKIGLGDSLPGKAKP